MRKTVEACWNVDPGLAGVRDITVEIRLQIDRSGKVIRTEVVDKARLSNPTFRTVAELAQRALMNGRCNTLPLPPDGYEFWKDAIFVFSPRDMLRGLGCRMVTRLDDATIVVLSCALKRRIRRVAALEKQR